MSNIFLDASALIKRHLQEAGSQWVRQMIAPSQGNVVMVAEISLAEVSAALAARARAPHGTGITKIQRDQLLKDFLDYCRFEYRLMSIERSTIDQAVILTQSYRLRGYDAVQLATALKIKGMLANAKLSALTFIAADKDLLAAASAEGLATENPNNHA